MILLHYLYTSSTVAKYYRFTDVSYFWGSSDFSLRAIFYNSITRLSEWHFTVYLVFVTQNEIFTLRLYSIYLINLIHRLRTCLLKCSFMHWTLFCNKILLCKTAVKSIYLEEKEGTFIFFILSTMKIFYECFNNICLYKMQWLWKVPDAYCNFLSGTERIVREILNSGISRAMTAVTGRFNVVMQRAEKKACLKYSSDIHHC